MRYMLVVLDNNSNNWEIIETSNSMETICEVAKGRVVDHPYQKCFIFTQTGYFKAEVSPLWVGIEKQ